MSGTDGGIRLVRRLNVIPVSGVAFVAPGVDGADPAPTGAAATLLAADETAVGSADAAEAGVTGTLGD